MGNGLISGGSGPSSGLGGLGASRGSEYQNAVPISQDEAQAGSGWLNGLDLYEELGGMLSMEDSEGYSIIEKAFIDRGMQKQPGEYYGLISRSTSRIIQIKLCEATSVLEAQNQSSYLLLQITEQGSIGLLPAILLGPFENPSPPQSDIERMSEIIDSEIPANIATVADTDSSTSNKFSNLGFDKSFGISATANSIVTEKRLQEQINNQKDSVSPVGNSLNSKGIYTNRPTVLINSSFVPLTSEASVKRFEASIMYQLLKNNKLYNYFQNLKKTDIETYIELSQEYEEFQRTIKFSLEMIDEIDRFKKDFVNSLNNYSDFGLESIGYTDKTKTTKAFNQLIYEIGAMPFSGDVYFANHINPSIVRSDISSDEERYDVTNRSVYLNPNNGLEFPILTEEPKTLWRYTKENDPEIHLTLPPTLQDQLIVNGDPYNDFELFENDVLSVCGGSTVHSTTIMSQFIWCELYKSYVYATGNVNKRNVMEQRKDNKNIFYDLIGDSFESSLVGADNSSGIAHVLRYPESGKIVMPLEKPGLEFEDEGFSGIKTGIESWVDPNVGNLFEGRSFDFNGLDFWVEEFSKFVDHSKSLIDPYAISGGGQLLLNEFIRNLEKVGDEGERYHMKKKISPVERSNGSDSFNAFASDLKDVSTQLQNPVQVAVAT